MVISFAQEIREKDNSIDSNMKPVSVCTVCSDEGHATESLAQYIGIMHES